MPEDVIIPSEEVVVEEPVVEEVVEEISEETPAEEVVEEPVESAEDLKKQLADTLAENERLKAEKPEKEAAPAPVTRVAAQHFLNNILPESKTKFIAEGKKLLGAVSTDENGQIKINEDALGKIYENQYQNIFEMADQLVSAIQRDQINPSIQTLATAVISVLNELEIRDLRLGNPDFQKSHEKQIRSQLQTSRWEDREKEGFVTGLLHKVLGAAKLAPSKPTGPKALPTAAPSLRDIAGGKGGSPTKAQSGIRLTSEQEADRIEMEEESGVPMPKELYYSKLQARTVKLKAAGKPAPKTLRSI